MCLIGFWISLSGSRTSRISSSLSKSMSGPQLALVSFSPSFHYIYLLVEEVRSLRIQISVPFGVAHEPDRERVAITARFLVPSACGSSAIRFRQMDIRDKSAPPALCVDRLVAFQPGKCLDGLPGLLLGEAQVVEALEIEPKLRARAKEMSEAQSGVARNGARPIQDLRDAIGRHVDLSGQFSRAHIE